MKRILACAVLLSLCGLFAEVPPGAVEEEPSVLLGVSAELQAASVKSMTKQSATARIFFIG